MRILIVENEATQGESLQVLLRVRGHDCDWAANADSAVSRLAVHTYDALIVDQKMPGTSGMEFIRQIRSRPGYENVPIALATGLDDDTLREEVKSLPGVVMLKKPCGWEEIEAVLTGGVK